MEAKDTVMNEATLKSMYMDASLSTKWKDLFMLVTQAQAKISFKAGQDSVFDSMPDNLPPLLETAHRSGRKEVVEWLLQDKDFETMLMCFYGEKEWKAQLKEWGI